VLICKNASYVLSCEQEREQIYEAFNNIYPVLTEYKKQTGLSYTKLTLLNAFATHNNDIESLGVEVEEEAKTVEADELDEDLHEDGI